MEEALIFLVIVLSTFLAIFLVLGIILLAKAIQVANRIKEISERAEHIAGKLEGAVEFLQKASGSLAIGKLVTKLADHLTSKKTNDDKEE